MQDRYAIGDLSLLTVMPEGCVEAGARRHALEYSWETGLPVDVFWSATSDDAWQKIGTVEAQQGDVTVRRVGDKAVGDVGVVA